MVQDMKLSTPLVVTSHPTGRISHDLSVQVRREVKDRSQRRRRRRSNSVDIHGSCSAPGTILDHKWRPPVREGLVKCNVNAYWVGPETLCGSAWIARDCNGSVLFHVRETLTPSLNRIVAELRCIWGAVQSLRDLDFKEVIISSDCHAAIAALKNPLQWPRYGSLVDIIFRISQSFSFFSFEIVSCSSNSVARDIAGSVIKDGRFNSYLARGGPRWLLNRIRRDAQDASNSGQPISQENLKPISPSTSPLRSPLTTDPPPLLSASPPSSQPLRFGTVAPLHSSSPPTVVPNHHIRFESPSTAPRCSASAKRRSVSLKTFHHTISSTTPPVQSKSMTIDRTTNHTGSNLIKPNEVKTQIDSEGFIKPLKTARRTKDVRQQNVSLQNDYDILSSEE